MPIDLKVLVGHVDDNGNSFPFWLPPLAIRLVFFFFLTNVLGTRAGVTVSRGPCEPLRGVLETATGMVLRHWHGSSPLAWFFANGNRCRR